MSTEQIVLKLDGRELKRWTVSYALRRAARGPSSLVGGSLVTGQSPPPKRTTVCWRGWGFTLHKRSATNRVGAVSLLAPVGDGVPVQVVFGDWWKAT